MAEEGEKEKHCCISHEFFKVASRNPNKIAIIHASGGAQICRDLRQKFIDDPDFVVDDDAFFDSHRVFLSNLIYQGDEFFTFSDILVSVESLSSRIRCVLDGGNDPNMMRPEEISRPENQGLSATFNLLEEAKKEIDSYSKGGPISFSDLIQYAAQSAVKRTFLDAAIRKCGGNEEKGNLLYTCPYGSNGQWNLFNKQLGRSDTQEPDPEGRVPLWEKVSVQEMKDKFSAVGFGPRQLAVMSAFLGPDQLATNFTGIES